MVKHIDPFWDYVEKLDDGPFKCAFCGYKFAAATSVSRIKWHLSGVKGRGVKICEKVTEDVQDAARAAIDRPPEKKHKTIAGSSNNEVTNAISTSIPQQEECLPEQGEALPQQGEGLSPGVLAWIDSITYKDIELMLDAPVTRPRTEQMQRDCEGRTSDFLTPCTEDNVLENPSMGLTQHFERRSSPEWLSINQDERRGYSSQPTDPLFLTLEKCYDQLCTPSLSSDVIMNDVEIMVRDSSTEGLQHNGYESSDILDEITQYLLGDSQVTSASDEKSLLSRVNTLCCLLQKDPATARDLQPKNLSDVNVDHDGRRDKNNSVTVPACHSKSLEGFPAREGEASNVSICKQAPAISRKDSIGELLLHLPRIASLPRFLFNIEEDCDNQAV